MCYNLHLRHKKCGHQSTVSMFCPLAPRHEDTRKPIGRLCQKSKAAGKVYRKRSIAPRDINWKCPMEECKDYERLRRYWRCCACRRGPNKDPFCKHTVPRQSFDRSRSRSKGRMEERYRGRSRSRSPKIEAEEGRVNKDRGRSPAVDEGKGGEETGDDDGSSRRRSVSTYRRTCGHQPCSRCTWFGATIPTYDRRAGNWTRSGSGSESDHIDETLSQIMPDIEEEPGDYPDDLMTDTEFDPELYDSDNEDYEDDEDGEDGEDGSDRYLYALGRMDVVSTVETGPDLGNIYDADIELEDDDEEEDGSTSEDEMEIDAKHDIDDHCSKTDCQDRSSEEETDAEFRARIIKAQRGINGMSRTESQEETDEEYRERVIRAQRGVNGMSLVETEEDTDADSESTVSDPEMDFDSDDEQADTSVDEGSEDEPRGSILAKPPQLGTEVEGQTDQDQIMEEGGPILSLDGFQDLPDRSLLALEGPLI
ncbi:hypothetical protein QBC36DRAFT_285627 [Triangularia setosa]|uniref:Uncharacterized protein n=1 Tax=Triangularia setosa TaxID=2587417 RepID=A0AAN6WGV1_9PEZI|nr:hypothetical protein QBC36DRAFT_285627 [Podospora setosa]